jgi:hypothetical protein
VFEHRSECKLCRDDYGRIPRGDCGRTLDDLTNYGSDGYALFGTAPNNGVSGIFSPSGGQTVFDFSSPLSNGQTTQTLLSVPSYVNGLKSVQLTSIKEGYNYTLIDNPLGGAQIASGNA